MAMEDEYDPFDVGGVSGVTGESTYVSTGGPGRGTAASQLGYSSDQVYGGGGDDGGGPPSTVSRPTTGLNQQQFQNRFGITNRNPYGNTGFAKFFDKFSRALGGKGVDYRPQFAAIDRRMGRDPGTTQQRMMNRQYDLYANPTINPQTGVIESGGIDRLGRGTIQAPVEEINRKQSLQEQLARGIAGVATPFGLPLSQIGTTELVDTRYVTDEMRDRGPQSMAEKLMSSLTGGADVSNVTEGVGGLGERMMNLFSGGATGEAKPDISPQNIPTQSTLEMDAMSAPTNAFTNRNAPNYGMEPTSYDMVQRQNRIPTPIAMPDEIVGLRTGNDLSVFGPNQGGTPVTIEGPIGRRYDLPSEELDAISRNYEIDGVTGPTPDEIDGFTPQPYGFDMDAMASYRGSRAAPVGPDMDALGSTIDPRGNQMAPTPGEGYGMFGPRTPDDLRAMGIEPSLEDLRDMGLKPSLAEVLAGLDPSKSISSDETVGISDIVQGAGLTPAGTSSLESFVENNPGIGEALLGSREGQQLNDIFKFGGMKPETSEVFVDTDKAEIRVQGPDFRGREKGFTIDASDFFGKQDLGELIFDTLQKGGMSILEDESQRDRAERMNQEFLENLEETERRAAEQGGVFSNIGYRS